MTHRKHWWLGAILAVAGLALAVAPVDGAAATPTAVTEFTDTLGGYPENIVPGPDGNMWFADGWYVEGSFHGSIGRITPNGTITQLDSGLNKFSRPEQIVVGPDENLWFADSGNGLEHAAIGRMTTAGAVTEFGGLGSTRPRQIIDGPDGELWFAANGSEPAIGKSTTSGTITKYVLPARPNVPVVGGGGHVWFTYGGGSGPEGAIARVVEESGGGATITLYRKGLAPGSWPWKIILGSDGNLWFADDGEGVGAVGRITPTGEIEEYRDGLRPDSEPEHLLVGPDGNIWFVDQPADAVGRITPNGTITEFSNEQLALGGGPLGLAVGPGGDLWFGVGSSGTPGIGRISTAGAITVIRPGASGLGYDAVPREITAGPGGKLWFVNRSVPTIGRVLPGDDSPPAGEARLVPAASPMRSGFPPQVRLAKGTASVRLNGDTAILLQCLSEGDSCIGQLELRAKSPRSAVERKIGGVVFAVASGATSAVPLQLNRIGRKWLSSREGARRARLVIHSPTRFTVAYETTVRLRRSVSSGAGRNLRN